VGESKFNPNSILLMQAQKAAFGGGSFAADPASIRGAEYMPPQKLYKEHYERQGRLYRGKVPWSQAAVGFFGSDDPSDAARHQARAHAAYDVMMRLHVATDILTAGVCTLENLTRYELVVLPDLRFLTDAHLDALRIFHVGGRELLVFGDPGDEDESVRRASEHPLAELSRGRLNARVIEETVAAMADRMRPTVQMDSSVDRSIADAVKAAAWADHPSSPSQVVVHVVNFNVGLSSGDQGVARIDAATVTVPFPAGPVRSRIIRVDDRVEERARPTVEEGHVMVEVKDIGIHTIVVFDRDAGERSTVKL
jgi:hypothetical protein